MRAFEQELYHFVENAHPGLLPSIAEKKTLTDQIKAQIDAILREFKPQFIKDRGKK